MNLRLGKRIRRVLLSVWGNLLIYYLIHICPDKKSLSHMKTATPGTISFKVPRKFARDLNTHQFLTSHPTQASKRRTDLWLSAQAVSAKSW